MEQSQRNPAAKSLYANESLENHSTSQIKLDIHPKPSGTKTIFIQTQRNMNDIHPKPSGTKTTFIQTQRNKNNKFVKTACGRSKFSGVIYACRGIYKFGRRFKLTVNLRVVFLFFTQRIGRQILCRFFYPVVC